MSTSWFYEPFYEIDRFMNELANKPEQIFARRGGGDQGGDTLAAQRPYRPRYVCSPPRPTQTQPH